MGNQRLGRKKSKDRFFWIEATLIVLLFAGSYVVGSYAKAQKEELAEDVFISSHDESVIMVTNDKGAVVETRSVDYDDLISDYRNILLVGVDARDQNSISQGSNADVIIIVSINEKTGAIRMVSVLRDTLLRLANPGTVYAGRLYDKANSQICYTNISDMVSMINKNLDLNIQDYVVMNWMAAAQAVDTLGGVEVTIDNPAVLEYLNGYLTEVNEQTGIWSAQLESVGTHVLTGTQAVALCRVRYAGLGDNGRTENQRMVISQCLNRVKSLISAKPATVITAVSQLMDSVATNMSLLDLGNLVFQAGNFELEGSRSFPFDYVAGEYLGQIYDLTGGVKDALVAKELADNVVTLHEFLFPEAAYAYKLPEDISKISEDIAWMSGVTRSTQ